MTKGTTYVVMGLTDKDLRRICGSQYEHPGSAIGYLPETCLVHVYIVLEPAGSAHLRFDVVLCVFELYGWLPNVARSPG